ncbi:hypothetical protein [Prevotella sp.]|uniref:hypothetical protein n=1 Tax=uncultured Prevotella sp. TaxID=159272 RepID=UPI0027E2CC6F|nr:hypothetical protein [Prevotella sp.]
MRKLVDETNVDMQVAMRFFYNSDYYLTIPDGQFECDIDKAYAELKREFECG